VSAIRNLFTREKNVFAAAKGKQTGATTQPIPIPTTTNATSIDVPLKLSQAHSPPSKMDMRLLELVLQCYRELLGKAFVSPMMLSTILERFLRILFLEEETKKLSIEVNVISFLSELLFLFIPFLSFCILFSIARKAESR
jgi:hypothetical protein